jgi:hypothetical protein
MKEKELREHAICSRCKKKIGHLGMPLFWTVNITRYGIKVGAIRRQAGLEMMLGNVALAQVIGPNEEMTEVMDSADLTLCEDCAMSVLELLEQSRG